MQEENLLSRAILLARYRLLRSTKILPKAVRILSSVTMSTGYNIYVSAEMAYSRGDIVSAFESYQKAIRKILKDENPTAKVPIPASRLPLLPPHQPLELLGAVWQNFVGFFRDPQMNFTEESAPEAYKLLASFRPNAGTSLKSHTRLERTERGKILLKGMQVTTALTLGLLAWDKKDRATAAKRYQEGIDLAKTVPDFMDPPKGMKGWEVYVNGDMKQVKENLGLIVKNDMVNAELIRLAGEGEDSREPKRKETVELPLPQMRIDKKGNLERQDEVKFATNACAKCGKRETKLLVCGACKNAQYCDAACQKADWKTHKANCVKKA